MSNSVTRRRFGSDLLRAIAVLMVLLAHAGVIFIPLYGFPKVLEMSGHYGVEFFFVLSGFLVGGLLLDGDADGPGGWRRFWARRCWRTWPLYYLFLALNIVLMMWRGEPPTELWSFVVFSQNLISPHPNWFHEAWSLSVEEWFYLLAPLCLALAGGYARRRRILFVLVAIIVMAAVVRVIYFQIVPPVSWDENVRKVVVARLDAIAWGVLGAWWVRNCVLQPATRRHFAWLGVVGLFAMVGFYLSQDMDHSAFARWALLPILAASIVLLLPWLQALERPDAGWVGSVEAIARWSYPLYLIQVPVLRSLKWGLGWEPTTLGGCLAQALVYLVLSIGGAAALHRWVEKPLLRRRDRVWARRGGSSATPLPRQAQSYTQ